METETEFMKRITEIYQNRAVELIYNGFKGPDYTIFLPKHDFTRLSVIYVAFDTNCMYARSRGYKFIFKSL